MENQTTQEIKHLTDRVNDVNKRINHIDGKVDKVDDKVDKMEEKFNDRHIDMVELTTTLKADSKASRESTERLNNSIGDFFHELKESNKINNVKFEKVEKSINKLEMTVNDKALAINVDLEEKKMSKGLLGTILVSVIGLVGVLAKVIAPLVVG
ncbi:hypothetical protein JTF04_02540 [Mammaliicoccus vitulinus]|uniref:hypothetical protein n=1 Tax=Mammaliicoccus vitulinus TaxID=71237 RepID=UPI00195208CD|nr:hypothetical protein [Mammaliicoccus vitulinus]MBM6628546.1 hypothetical protein [Mammaliicoccus vitulinus]